jgi:HEAT repeat protein
MPRIPIICLLLVLMVRPLTGQVTADSSFELAWPPSDMLTPFLLYEEPYLPVAAPQNWYDPAMLPLIEESLRTNNAGLQRDAAVCVTLLHEGGYLDCSSARSALRSVLEAKGRNRLVRKDVARALVAIDARDSADVMFAAMERDADLIRIVEPALARWKYGPAQDTWRQRLENFETEPAFLVLSAIRGLGESRDQKAVPLLQAIILHSVRAVYRSAAADALGRVSEVGLEKFAGRLLSGESDALGLSSAAGTPLHRLLAVKVLRNHDSEAARAVLLSLATDPDGAVASVAWESLLRSAPREVRPLTEKAVLAGDARVRMSVVEALLATPDKSAIEQLGQLLDDQHPDVRNSARRALLTISGTPELRQAVIATGVTALSRDRWEGLEQSAVLLGRLDHEPAAERCFELLHSPRAEVAIAAAWALRKLSIPATLPRMLEYCQGVDNALVSGRLVRESDSGVVSHLFEAMGQMQYEPAEALLRRYIPKAGPRLIRPMRQSAITALGLLKAGSGDEDLSEQFYQRLIDQNPLPIFELENVRYASVIAIGRIKAPAFESKLRAQYSGRSIGKLLYSIEWALTQYTGEPLGESEVPMRGFPLLPLRPTGFRLESRTPVETPRPDDVPTP